MPSPVLTTPDIYYPPGGLNGAGSHGGYASAGGGAASNVAVGVFHAFYSVVNNFTSLVGLSPVQFLFVAGGFLVLAFVWQGYCAWRGKTSFTLEDA